MSISTKPQGPVENRLLAALPDEVLARLLPHLQPASFALGGVVYESSERMERLYFPTTCIVSLLYTMTDGATAEMGLVGNDGVVGIALFMGGNTVPNRAVAQVAGDAFSAPAPVLLEEFRRGGPCQLQDRRLQPPSLGRAATLPLAAAHTRPGRVAGIAAHPGVHRQHAGRTPRKCHQGGQAPATGRADSLRPRPHHDPRPSGTGSGKLRMLSSRQNRV
jgi:hypothetical protein